MQKAAELHLKGKKWLKDKEHNKLAFLLVGEHVHIFKTLSIKKVA
jgi:hypothetical protein